MRRASRQIASGWGCPGARGSALASRPSHGVRVRREDGAMVSRARSSARTGVPAWVRYHRAGSLGRGLTELQSPLRRSWVSVDENLRSAWTGTPSAGRRRRLRSSSSVRRWSPIVQAPRQARPSSPIGSEPVARRPRQASRKRRFTEARRAAEKLSMCMLARLGISRRDSAPGPHFLRSSLHGCPRGRQRSTVIPHQWAAAVRAMTARASWPGANGFMRVGAGGVPARSGPA